MEITIKSNHPDYLPNSPLIERLIIEVFSQLNIKADEVSLLFTTDSEITSYNKRFRRREEVTDVLSFPLSGETIEGKRNLGDIIISVDAAFRQAREAGHGFSDEITLLIIHGLLHLLGYDHQQDSGEMRRLEGELFQRLRGGSG
jgi:probable rRNA maturation factor